MDVELIINHLQHNLFLVVEVFQEKSSDLWVEPISEIDVLIELDGDNDRNQEEPSLKQSTCGHWTGWWRNSGWRGWSCRCRWGRARDSPHCSAWTWLSSAGSPPPKSEGSCTSRSWTRSAHGSCSQLSPQIRSSRSVMRFECPLPKDTHYSSIILF